MPLNVYQIYDAVGCKCPFVITQTTWGKTAFCVESIAGEFVGKLSGIPPYYGNPDVEGYYINTETNEIKPDMSGTGILSCPGNFKWHLLKPVVK